MNSTSPEQDIPLHHQKKGIYSKPVFTKLNDFLKGKRVVLVGPAPYLENSGRGRYIDNFDVVGRMKKGYPIPTPLSKDIGSRTHLYFTNFKKNHNNLNVYTYQQMFREGVKFIIFPYPIKYQRGERNQTLYKLTQKNFTKQMEFIRNNYSKRYPFRIPITYDGSSDYFNFIENVMGTRPTTGLLAVLDLLQYDVKEVHLIGFTFRYELILEQMRETMVEFEHLRTIYSQYYKNDEENAYSWRTTIRNHTHELTKEIKFFKRLMRLDKRITVDAKLQGILDNFNDNRYG